MRFFCSGLFFPLFFLFRLWVDRHDAAGAAGAHGAPRLWHTSSRCELGDRLTELAWQFSVSTQGAVAQTPALIFLPEPGRSQAIDEADASDTVSETSLDSGAQEKAEGIDARYPYETCKALADFIGDDDVAVNRGCTQRSSRQKRLRFAVVSGSWNAGGYSVANEAQFGTSVTISVLAGDKVALWVGRDCTVWGIKTVLVSLHPELLSNADGGTLVHDGTALADADIITPFLEPASFVLVYRDSGSDDDDAALMLEGATIGEDTPLLLGTAQAGNIN